MGKKTISIKADVGLIERLDKVKSDYFINNRNAAIIKAIENLVASYSKEGIPVRDHPHLEAAKRQAEYLQEVLLYGIDCNTVLRKEVIKLCQLIN